MFAIDEQIVEWGVEITVATIAAVALIVVALVNTHRNRKTTEKLSKEVERVDTHASHIASLEERTQAHEHRTIFGFVGLGITTIWLAFVTTAFIVQGVRKAVSMIADRNDD